MSTPVKQLRISLDSSIQVTPIQNGWCPCSSSEETIFDETDKFALACAKQIKTISASEGQKLYHQLRLKTNECEEVMRAQEDEGLKEKMRSRMQTIRQRSINIEGALNLKTPKAFHLVPRTTTSAQKD